MLKREPIGLNNEFFKSYQVPLVRYVIDIRNKRLSKHFLDGNKNRPDVTRFREEFREAVEPYLEEKLDSEPSSKKLKTEISDGASNSFWSKISSFSLEFSDGFKKTLVLDENPKLNNPKEYSKEMIDLINKKN